MKNTPARLWIIPAKEAPVALVIRRKPHKVWHFLSWDLDNGRVESGDWTWGIFYPKGCDISWDGRLWTYHGDFGDKGSGLAPIARLTPLATWYSQGAWNGGGFFESPTSLLRSTPWFERLLPSLFRPTVDDSLRLGRTPEDVERLRLRHDGWQGPAPQSPDRWHAWQQPSPYHPRLTMDKSWSNDYDTVYRFSLSGDSKLIGPDVFRATYDATGSLLVARRGVLERYTLDDLERGSPSFRHDLNEIPGAPSADALKKLFRSSERITEPRQ